MEETLENILQIMKNHCPSDFGFLVDSSFEKPINEKRSNSNYEKLPHRRLRKSKFTGRVGLSNEWRKFHSKISVAEDKTPLPECIEETIPAEEKSNISNNKMLSDESIDLAQQLLKKQFPIFGGLQDIALSEHDGLDVVKKDKPFIQVLHNGSAHWICVFNSDRNRSENNTCHILSRGNLDLSRLPLEVNFI